MKKTAIVCCFISHYRKSLIRTLLTSNREFVLYAARSDPNQNVKAWDIPEDIPFRETQVRCLPGGLFLQHGLIQLAFRRDIDSIIYLGDVHFVMTWLSAALARLLGKRVFFWTHGYVRREVGAKRIIRKAFYRLANTLLFYGNRAKKIAIEEGFVPDQIHVIYNGLNYDLQKRIRGAITASQIRSRRAELFGDDDHLPIAIFSGRLTSIKQLDLLIEAAALLKSSGYPINVLFIGDGPAKASLETLASERGVNARFVGACYDEQILGELTMAADVTVSPGNVGLTAMQSLAYGTPVVTHDTWDEQMPEWEAILPGKTGDFFHKDDIISLSEAIRRQTASANNRADIRDHCIEIIEQYWNPTHQAQCILRALDGCSGEDNI